MAKKKAIVQAKVKETQTPLTKLLANKGYRKIFTGATNEIHIAIDQISGAICLIEANQGSQHFKEMMIPDEVIDYLFSLIYKDCEYTEEKDIKPSKIAKTFIDLQDYKYIKNFERDVKEFHIKNECLVRNMPDEHVISILQISFVNDTFTNIINMNLEYSEVAQFTDYLIELSKKAQEALKQENASKNEQDADVPVKEESEEK